MFWCGQEGVNPVKFYAAVFGRLAQAAGEFSPGIIGAFDARDDFIEQDLARLVIDGAAVVRINQRKVPQFVPLVQVGRTGSGELDERAGNAVPESGPRDAGDQRLHCGKERRVASSTVQK